MNFFLIRNDMILSSNTFTHVPTALLLRHVQNCGRSTKGHSSAVTTHYGDVKMGTMASQITSLTIVYSTVYSGAD